MLKSKLERRITMVTFACALVLLYLSRVYVGDTKTTESPTPQAGDDGGVIVATPVDLAQEPQETTELEEAGAAMTTGADPGVTMPFTAAQREAISKLSAVKSGPPDLGPETLETEIIKEDPDIDGVNTEIQENPVAHNFISEIKKRGNTWYTVTNFCVVDGQFTTYHDPRVNRSWKGSLTMANEFSRHSKTIELKYSSEPLPDRLPGPVLTKTKGWMFQTWCQDLFHMTLAMMPAYHTLPHLGPHPDIYIRIAKGVRKKKNQMCRVKLGNPTNFSMVRNKKWNDHQFPFAGNPYWPFYKLLTPDPHRILPMYKGATKKRVCYTNGIIDKYYLKELDGFKARQYVEAQQKNFGVLEGEKRKCGRYRLTLIDRRGKTRRLNNTDEILALTDRLGFTAQAVRLEHLPIRSQIALMTESDVLLGVHGNGLTWLQFLQTGSVVVEMVGIWYMPYSLLFGHKYLHSSMKHNPFFKKHGEYVPFPANLTELETLLVKAKVHLDAISCPMSNGSMVEVTPSKQRLEMLYKGCAPHC